MEMIDDKREQILNNARTLFAQLGYAGVGIRKIAELSKCNLSAISYYFGGKENLYAECFKIGQAEDVKGITDILGTPKTTEEFNVQLHAFCTAFAKYATDNSELMRLLASELNSQILSAPNVPRNTFAPILNPLLKFIETAKEAEILKSELNPPLLARMLLSGLVIELVFIKETESTEKFIKDLITICTGRIYV